jgi:hypothetical protein
VVYQFGIKRKIKPSGYCFSNSTGRATAVIEKYELVKSLGLDMKSTSWNSTDKILGLELKRSGISKQFHSRNL